MKSIGEAIGYDYKLHRAVYKAGIASVFSLPVYGTVIVSVAGADKEEAVPLIQRFYDMGFTIEATMLTGEVLQSHGIYAKSLARATMKSLTLFDKIISVTL